MIHDLIKVRITPLVLLLALLLALAALALASKLGVDIITAVLVAPALASTRW